MFKRRSRTYNNRCEQHKNNNIIEHERNTSRNMKEHVRKSKNLQEHVITGSTTARPEALGRTRDLVEENTEHAGTTHEEKRD